MICCLQGKLAQVAIGNHMTFFVKELSPHTVCTTLSILRSQTPEEHFIFMFYHYLQKSLVVMETYLGICYNMYQLGGTDLENQHLWQYFYASHVLFSGVTIHIHQMKW